MPLILSFSTRDLRDDCLSDRPIELVNGIEITDLLRSKLADMYAVDNVTELPWHSRVILGESKKPLYTVPLVANIFLVFEVVQSKSSYVIDGRLDWTKVYRLKLLSIGN